MKPTEKMEQLFNMMNYLDGGAKGNFEMMVEGKKVVAQPKQVQAFVAKQVHNSLLDAYTRIETVNGPKAIQAFTGTSDISAVTTSVWNALQESPNYDTLWQMAFRTVPLRKGQLEWSIGNVKSGVIFQLLEEGAKVEYQGISGTVTKGSVDLYGAGLEIDWKTMEGRDLAGFYNVMLDFSSKRMSEYSDLFYGLLATAGATNTVAWQGVEADATIDRDIATLNKGYDTIGSACKDLGMGDTANVRMLIYAAPSLRPRINAALKATASDLVRSGGKGVSTVDANIEPLYTYTSKIAANEAIMVLPGHKIQNAIYMQEKSFERQNPDNLNFLKSSFTAIGGIVGETDQTAELSFA